MALPNLSNYRYSYRSVDIVGTPLLTNSASPTVIVDQTTSSRALGAFDASGLSAAPYNFEPTYPLTVKLFCNTVKMDRTGEFEVSVSGSLGGSNTKCRRSDEKDFALTWKVRDWNLLAGADATVSVKPLSPVTSVSMHCVCGLAPDAIDQKDQGSYA